MKYEYKVVVIVNRSVIELNNLLSDGWEVVLVNPEKTSKGYNQSAMFFTIRKEIKIK